MEIKLTFSKDNPIRPKLTFSMGEYESEVKRERWIQFFALLAYYRLADIEDGWVILEDIHQLSAFKKAKPKVIGKYLSTSRNDFPFQICKFIDRCMNITTTGPYKLLLGREKIITELDSLGEFIDLISLKPITPKTDGQLLWQAVNLTYQKFELKSCMEILQQYILVRQNNPENPTYKLPLAYLMLIRLERLIRRDIIDIDESIKSARFEAKKLKLKYERNILLAYTYAVEALSHAKNNDTYKLILELNNKSIELLNEIPEVTADKLCLLGAIHYNNYQASIFNQKNEAKVKLESVSQIIFEKAIKYYQEMEKLGRPLIVNFEKGIIEGIRFLNKLIIKSLRNESITEDELYKYSKIVEDGSVSKFVTLVQGEWIRKHFTATKQFKRAHEFGQKCLIDHAQLHETTQFQRIIQQQEEVLKKINS